MTPEPRWGMSRRVWLGAAAMLGAGGMAARPAARAAAAGPTLPSDAAAERVDFESKGIEGWTTVHGQWAVEDMPGAPSGRRVLTQRATANQFNVIVAPFGPYSDVDVSVKFKPIAGKEDASGGIVFRFTEGRYYVVRANALENNFRLYYYDRGRSQIASSETTPPVLGGWHTIRLLAVGDRLQAWLDGAAHLDKRHSRLALGKVGLWTKADSITAFDDLDIRGVVGGR